MNPSDHTVEETQDMITATATATAATMEQPTKATTTSRAVPATGSVALAPATQRAGVLQLAVPRAIGCEGIITFVRAVVEQRAVLVPSAEELHAEDAATEG